MQAVVITTGIIIGLIFGYVFARIIPFKSKAAMYIWMIVILLITIAGVGLIGMKTGIHPPRPYGGGLSSSQIARLKPDFSERLGYSIGKTTGIFGLGYLAYIFNYVRTGLAKLK